MRRAALGLLLLLGAAVIAARMSGFGCLTGRWVASSARPPNAERLEGDWIGTWTSDLDRMGGALHCRIRKVGEGEYQATFEAVFARFFTFKSPVTLKVLQKGPTWTFAGERDLGLLAGGTYKYDGHSDGADFVCTYDSKWNKGTFRMKHVVAATQPAASK
jgi:hypothetical protein